MARSNAKTSRCFTAATGMSAREVAKIDAAAEAYNTGDIAADYSAALADEIANLKALRDAVQTAMVEKSRAAETASPWGDTADYEVRGEGGYVGRATVVRDLDAFVAEFPGVAVGREQLDTAGLGYAFDEVDQIVVLEGPTTFDGALFWDSSTSNLQLLLSRSALAGDPVALAFTVRHEVAHAVDGAFGVEGISVHSSSPRLTPGGDVHTEYVAQVLGGGPTSAVLDYAFDYEGTRRTEEMFAQLMALGTKPGNLAKMSPAFRNFIEGVLDHAKSNGEADIQRARFAAAKAARQSASKPRPHAPNPNAGQRNAAPIPAIGRAQGNVLPGVRQPVAAKSTPLNAAASNFLTSIKDKVDWISVRSMLTSDLIAAASKVIPTAQKYMASMTAVNAEKGRAERVVADIVEDFSKLSRQEQGVGQHSVNRLLKDSTVTKAWAFVPDWLPAGTVTVDPALAARFNSSDFSDAGRSLVKRVFKQGHDSLKELQKAVIDNTSSEYDALIQELTAAGKLDEAKVETQKKAKSLKDFEGLLAMRTGWPYAPLRRFGKHVVMAMSARYVEARRNNDVTAMREMETNGDHYYVAFAESKAEARKQVAELKDSYPGGDVGTFEKLEQADSMVGGRDMLGAMRRLRKIVSEESEDKDLGEKTGARVDDLMRQLYLTLLSETSARKGEIHRKNIAGADKDMMRAFSTQGVATAHFIASLKTNGAIEDNLQVMRNEVRTDLADRDEKQRYFNEIMRRHSMNLEFNPTPGVDRALAVSSIYMLLSNPSYFLMNATQPWMMSHPMMAGQFGYAKSAAALLRGSRDTLAVLRKDGRFDEKGYAHLPPDVRAAIEALANRGVIQIELGQELGQFRSSSEGNLRHLNTALGKLHGVAQGVETMNRLSTAIAAFRLQRDGGASEASAIDYAAKVINETHGDYTGFNAPRFMRTSVGRVTTQFRKFQLIQLSMFARLAQRAFKGASKEERLAARYALGYNLAHLTAIGGLAALPGFTAAAWLVGKAIPDDDEPDDPRGTMTRLWGKDWADLLWGGASQAAGVPLGGRIGAGNMLSVLPYTDIEVSREGYSGILMGLTGPLIGGLLPRAYDGVRMAVSGDLWKGAEALAPSGVANVSKAVRFQVQGVTQRNGDVAMSAEEVGFLDSALQAVGLPTNTIQDRSYLVGAKFKADTFYKDRTTALKRAYTEAYRSNDSDALREAREDWQATQVARRGLGFQVQPLSDLLKAPQEQRKREAGMVGGVSSNKSNAGFLAAMTE
jgi:hypothetical protein